MQSFKPAWKRRLLIVFMLAMLPLSAHAYLLSPSLIQEPEGSYVQVTVTAESSDWRVPDQSLKDFCIDVFGFVDPQWVLTFRTEGVSGSADFGSGPADGDLYFSDLHGPLDPTVEWLDCSDSISLPGPIVYDGYEIALNNDGLMESLETAQLDLYDVDFTDGDNLIFQEGIDISIEDTNADNGVLSICCDMEVNETDSMATATVTRSGSSVGAITVDYLTGNFDQSATEDVDYVGTSGTLEWADGDASDRFISVPILDDSEFEGLEYFWIDIITPTGGATLDPEFFFVEVDILDDDEPTGVVTINSFTASPSTIDIGDTTTLSWSVSNATICTPSGGTGGWSETSISLPSGSTQITLTKAGSFPFGLSCTDDLTSDIANTTVEVIGPPPVTIDSFTATPSVIDPGQSSTISWSVSNADSCTALGGTGGWAGSSISLPSGSASITFPVAGNFVFELNCSNVSSAVLTDTTVVVSAPPEVTIDSFTANPNPLAEGEATTLSWSVSNADSCTASDGAGGWAGSVISLPSGSLAVTLATAGSYTFTLQCSNSFESSDIATTTVTVEANPPVVINSFSASPNVIDEGQTTSLSWTVSNADSCIASGGDGGWDGSAISLPSGSQSVTLVTAGSYTFTLQCSNAAESSDTASTTVTVAPPDTVVIGSFTATPDTIEEAQSTTLAWSVSNADSCIASDGAGGWAGSLISLPTGSQSVTLPTAGTYTFTLQCSNAAESSDIARTTVTVQSGTEPDLAASNVGADKTTLVSGDEINISATVTNVGTATAASATIRYYLSTNNAISETDTLLGTSESPDLDAGIQFMSEIQTVLSPDPGSYYVGVCVDVVPGESNAENNCSTGPQITVESGSTVACNSRPISCGQSMNGSLSSADCMSGPRGAGYYAQKFTFNGEIGSPLFVGASWNDGLDGYLFLQGPSGLTEAENDNYTSSADSQIEYEVSKNGTHTIWASSYEPGASGSYSVSLTCSSPSGPDLTLTVPSLETATLISGQNMTVGTMLHNVGDQSSNSTTLKYLLSSDAIIDSTDTLLGSDGASGLAQGGSSNQQLELQAPGTAGPYYLGVCAEPVVDEASVSNNCSAGKPVTVKSQPECTRRTLSCGQQTPLSETLSADDCTNSPRGNGFLAEDILINAAGFPPSDDGNIRLSINATWTRIDGYLMLLSGGTEASFDGRQVLAENDDSGSSSTSRIELTVPEEGIYSLVASDNKVFESGRTGTYELELVCGTSSDPDLVASEVSVADVSVTVTDPIALSASVQNAGGSSAEGTNVYFLLSRDEGISLDLDEVLGSNLITSLDAGGSTDVSLQIDPLTEAGNYWFGICADAVDGETLTENNCSQISQATVQSSRESVDQAEGRSKTEAFGPKGTRVVVSLQPDCSNSSLSCGQSQSGTLAQGDCDQSPRGTGYLSDPFTFSGNAGDVVSLNAEWTGVDGYLYLEAPDGSVAGENDDFQDKDHSRYEQVLGTSGTYTVWPTAYEQGQGGSYDLSLGCNAPSAPDLVVEKPQLSTTTARPGQSVVVSTAASNQGSGPANATTLEFILATSSTLSEDDRVLGTADVAGLAGGASSSESLMVPLNVTPGTYWVGTCVESDVTELNSDNNCDVAGPITIEANDEPIPINTGLNDAWFNPQTNGQGFFINVFPDGNTVFLSWFTFDINRPAPGTPFILGDPGQRWLTAQGTYDLGVATLDMSLTQGGVFDSPTPVPTTDANPYGSMTVSFSDCNNGVINFDIPSVSESGSIPITRVASDNVIDCEDQIGALASQQDSATMQASKSASAATQAAGGASTIEATTDSGFSLSQGFSDAWFNPATNGQGFFVNVFPTLGQVFLSWFTYDTERPPGSVSAMLGEPGHRWITAQGPFDGDTAVLTIFNTSGGIFNEGTPVPVSVAYGTITVKFDDCNSGTIEYSIPSLGLTGTVPIQRLARDSIPGCELKSDDMDDTLALSPVKGDVLENLCQDSVDWNFDWPDDPRASRYDFRLFRSDNSVEFASTLFNSVKESKISYSKLEAVPDVHRNGWSWQYKPVYTGFGKKGVWSELQTFDVQTTADPCLD